MTYEELKEVFQAYRLEKVSRAELRLAIGLWQLSTYGEVAC